MKPTLSLPGIFILIVFIHCIEATLVTTKGTDGESGKENENVDESHSAILNWLFGRSDSEPVAETKTKTVEPSVSAQSAQLNSTGVKTARQLLLTPAQALLLQQQQQQQQQQQIAAAAINQAIINRQLQNSDLDDSSEEDDFDSDEFWDQSPLKRGNLALLNTAGVGGLRLYRSEEEIDEVPVAGARQEIVNGSTTTSPVSIPTAGNSTTPSPITAGNVTTPSTAPGNLTTANPPGNLTTANPPGNLTTANPPGNLTTISPISGQQNVTAPTGTNSTGNLTTLSPTGGNLTTVSPMGANLTTPASPGNLTTPSAGNLTTPSAGDLTTPSAGNLTTISPTSLSNLTTTTPSGLNDTSTATTDKPDPISSNSTEKPDNKKPPYKDTLNCRCGMQSIVNENVGYANQEVSTYPWMVSIESKNPNKHLCAGNIINNKFIITAASCLQGYDPRDLEIEAGLLSGNKTSFTAKKVFVHPQYEESTYANNLALIQVEETIRPSSSIKFICLPIAGKPQTASGTIVTWRESKANTKSQKLTLVQAQVQEVKDKRCKELLTTAGAAGKLTPGSFCTAPPPRNECGSDVGGAFLTPGKGYSSSLTGVISWTTGCKKGGVPAIHTYVQQYVRWILFKSQGGEYCRSPSFSLKDFSYLPE